MVRPLVCPVKVRTYISGGISPSESLPDDNLVLSSILITRSDALSKKQPGTSERESGKRGYNGLHPNAAQREVSGLCEYTAFPVGGALRLAT